MKRLLQTCHEGMCRRENWDAGDHQARQGSWGPLAGTLQDAMQPLSMFEFYSLLRACQGVLSPDCLSQTEGILAMCA